MKFFLKRRNGRFYAVAEYDEKAHTFTVLKGSSVSDSISVSPKFRSKRTIAKLRDEFVHGVEVTCDVVFKSPSTAANFVTGSSTNGCKAWRDEKGRSFKEVFGGD